MQTEIELPSHLHVTTWQIFIFLLQLTAYSLLKFLLDTLQIERAIRIKKNIEWITETSLPVSLKLNY